MKRWTLTGASLLCVAALMAGCGTSNNAAGNQGRRAVTYGTTGYGNGIYGDGMLGNDTTNATNGRTGLFGTRGYNDNRGGLFGTNGLNGNNRNRAAGVSGYTGVSSYLEGQLRASGINGAKVLVLGDTVIVGDPLTRGTNNTGAGTTGTYAGPGTTGGTTTGAGGVGGTTGGGMRGTTGGTTDNMMGATGRGYGGGMAGRAVTNDPSSMIQSMLGPQTRVLRVSDINALNALDRLKGTPTSAKSYARDVAIVMHSALKSGRTGGGGVTNQTNR